jgi:hypothetical protein
MERSFEAGGEVIARHVIDSHCGEFGMLKWQRLYCRFHSYRQTLCNLSKALLNIAKLPELLWR